MGPVVITARVRPGSVDAVRRILGAGPPCDLETTSLEAHRVFVSGDELVFLFEGPHADEYGRLVGPPSVLGQVELLSAHLAGPPRISEEIFSWARPERLNGVDFGPLPGPGDSEGGPVD
ncbi:MAG: hypothetical protein ACJ76S_02040 [Solirubrobacteraceae bacterium]|jgi:hypothetical protein